MSDNTPILVLRKKPKQETSDMAKVAIKDENITSFGGIFHIMDIFSKLGLGKLIDSTLGQCGNTSKAFQYSNILSSVFYSYLCGADCLEDINTLAPQFSMMPNTIHPSSDTVGRGLKELKPENGALANFRGIK